MNCARWNGSSAAASSGNGRKVLITRPPRYRDSPLKPNVVTRRDRIMAGHSSMVIPLPLIVTANRDIIGQARPAAGGGRRPGLVFEMGNFGLRRQA